MIVPSGVDAETVPELLSRTAERFGDRVALIAASGGDADALRRVTYAELADSARRVATELVGPGGRVGILLDNTCAVEAVTAYHAAHLARAVSVPLNTRHVAAELAGAVETAGVTTVVAHAGHRPVLDTVRERIGRDLTVVEIGTEWDSLLRGAPADPVPVSAGDDADWIFSSGTTGAPKAARFTHGAVLACSDGVARAWTLGAGDVYQSSAPFSTSTGVHTNPLGALAAAATYLVDPDTTLPGFLDRARAHGTTVCFLVTTMLRLLADEHDDELGELTALRRVVYGGMAAPPEVHVWLHERLTARHGVELMHLMGLTEGGPTGLYLDPADHVRKPGSIGDRAFSPHVEWSVRDEHGAPVPTGETGELCFSGPSLTAGYLDEDPAAPAVVDGRLRTGDLVRVDDDGFAFFVDRSKDIIRRGGLNIAASEIEGVLALVEHVTAAAVVAKPHDVLGEDVCAFVETGADLDPDALRAHCREHLADYKVPRDLRVVRNLPRNAMGRIVKSDLRAAATA